MDHLAIMDRRLGFVEKILSREKTIESRWYKSRRSPWGKIKKGDTVYFKNSGDQVRAKTQVTKVIQLEKLTSKRIEKVLNQYRERLGISQEMFSNFYQKHKDKKYGILIFLSSSVKVKPFQINKKGYGAMSAWICVDDIKKIIT